MGASYTPYVYIFIYYIPEDYIYIGNYRPKANDWWKTLTNSPPFTTFTNALVLFGGIPPRNKAFQAKLGEVDRIRFHETQLQTTYPQLQPDTEDLYRTFISEACFFEANNPQIFLKRWHVWRNVWTGVIILPIPNLVHFHEGNAWMLPYIWILWFPTKWWPFIVTIMLNSCQLINCISWDVMGG